MPGDERRPGNKEASSSGHGQGPDHDYHSHTHHGRRGDIARKTVNREPQRKLASKAARKTFAETLSDPESPEDEPSNRSERLTGERIYNSN